MKTLKPGSLRRHAGPLVGGMILLTLLIYPFIDPGVAGMCNLFFLIISTAIGYRKWGLVATAWTVIVTGIMDAAFWQVGFDWQVYVFGGLFNLFLSLVFGSILEQKHRYANSDGLTGLYNHGYLHENLERLIARCEQRSRTLTLLMLDLDNFKLLNDRHGHQFGDGVLRTVADILERSARHPAFAARYGGDEFALVIPDADATAAFEVVDTVIRQVTAERVEVANGEAAITVSIGGSEFAPGKSREDLIRDADSALYRAKKRGKNTAVIEKLGQYITTTGSARSGLADPSGSDRAVGNFLS